VCVRVCKCACVCVHVCVRAREHLATHCTRVLELDRGQQSERVRGVVIYQVRSPSKNESLGTKGFRNTVR